VNGSGFGLARLSRFAALKAAREPLCRAPARSRRRGAARPAQRPCLARWRHGKPWSACCARS